MVEKAARSSRLKAEYRFQHPTAFDSRRRGVTKTVAHLAEVLLQRVYLRHLLLRRKSSTRDGMHKNGHGGEKVSSTAESSISGQSPIQQFTGPLRVLVRGPRINLAFFMNFL